MLLAVALLPLAATAVTGSVAIHPAAPAAPVGSVTAPVSAPVSAAVSVAVSVAPWTVVHSGGRQTRRVSLTGYPYARQANPRAVDPATYMTERQCVDYAAWLLTARGFNMGYLTRGPAGIGTFANASTWAAAAKKAGYIVSATPIVGAVAQWNAYETSQWTINGARWWDRAGSAGHVAVVTAVYRDGTVLVSQYNGNGNRSYSSTRLEAPRYLYLGVGPVRR
jgi:surface antigen